MAETKTKTSVLRRDGNDSSSSSSSSSSSAAAAATATIASGHHRSSSGSRQGTRSTQRRNPVASSSFFFGGIMVLQVCWFLVSLHLTTTPSRTATTLRLPESGGGTSSNRKPPQLQISTTPTTIPIFYNLYISNVTDRLRVQTLMADQLALRDPTVYGPLYVTTVGGYNPANVSSSSSSSDTNENTNKNSSAFLESFVFGATRTKNHNSRKHNQQPQQVPPRSRRSISDYHHLGHYATGNELLSLQALWDYCQPPSEDNPEAEYEYDDPRLVVYLHSKGAYTDTLQNTKLRYFLTATALSDDCRQGLVQGGGGGAATTGIPIATQTTASNAQHESSPPRCNVCSGRFSPLPHPYVLARLSIVFRIP